MYGLQDVGEALSLYTKAIGVFMWFDRGRNKDNEDIPLVNTLGSKAVAGSSQEEVDKVGPDTTLSKSQMSNACLPMLMKTSDVLQVRMLYTPATLSSFAGIRAGFRVFCKRSTVPAEAGKAPGCHLRVQVRSRRYITH